MKLNRRGPDRESREFCGKILPIDKEWKSNEITFCRSWVSCGFNDRNVTLQVFSHIDYTRTRTLQQCFVSPNKIRIQWCKNEILEIELPSKIIYKPSRSPSADLCCSMLSLVSGCNLVASIASFTCIISKQWSFSGSEGQFTDTGSQGRTVLSQKTSGSFGAVKKAADTEFAGGYSVILILVCVSASLRFRFLTWHWKSCAVVFSKFPHQHACNHRCGFLLIRPYVDEVFKQNS